MADEGFLRRWSRRKQEAAVVPAPALAQEAAKVSSLSPVHEAAGVSSPLPAQAVGVVSRPVPVAEAGRRQPALHQGAEAPMPVQEASPLTLLDTESLTLASDFKPFLASSVAPEVKNAALRKLFADPHFNVMDRLDIYIDDYSNLAPLPASALRQMASAKFMNLFEEEEEAQVTPEGASPTETQTPASPPVVAPAEAEAQHASQRPDDPQDTDLRLQPDDAARAEDARRGTG